MGGDSHGGHGGKGFHLHPVKPIHRVVGTGMTTIMWLWIMYRAKKDGPVLMGWRHPWDGHGEGGHH